MNERIASVRVARAVKLLAMVAAAGLLAAACREGAPGVPTASPTPTSPPITATGRIAFITPEGALALVDPNGGNLRTLPDTSGVTDFTWSPDGSLLAVGESGGLRGIRPDGQQVFEIAGVDAPLWSPAGTRLAVREGSDVMVLDAAGQEVRRIAGAVRPSWSPDGASLAVARLGTDGLSVPVIVSVETGDETPLAADIEPAAPDYPVVWHPAGGWVAYRKVAYNLGDGSRRDLPGTAAEWNPDGRMLVVTMEYKPLDNATPTQLLDLGQGWTPVIGIDVRQPPDETPPWLEVQKWTDWTPDGRLWVYLDPYQFDPKLRIFDTVAIDQDKLPNVLGQRPDISPDSTHMAFMYKGKVWVMALNGSTLRAIVEGGFPEWQPGNQ